VIVVWRVTTRCALACEFCAYDRRLPRARHEADPAAVLAFGATLAAYQQATGDRMLVSWLGGEPLQWTPVWELARTFRADLGLRVSVTTNGTALASPAVRARLIADFAEVTVSVDGLEPFHDAIRGWRGGWTALARGVRALADETRRAGGGPRLRANVVVMRDNVGQLEPLADALAGWGVEELTINQLGGNDRPEFHRAHRLTPADADRLAAMFPGLRARLAPRGLAVLGGPGYLRRIEASARGEHLPVDDCRPGERFLFVDEAMRVAPCSFTAAHYGVPASDLTSVEALRALSARFVAARRARRAPACDDCPSTQVFEKFVAA
jgi:MoaA/NifB/PqqE/SkfB family radical SAM enzyme